MIKVLLMPSHTANMSGGGIGVYNDSLVDLFRESKDIDVSIFPIQPKENILGFKYDLKKLQSKISELSPDIIHVNGYTTQILKQVVKIAKSKNIKIVYTAHWHPFYTMNRSFMKKLYFDFFIKPYLKDTDAIVCINNEELQFFNQYASNIHLIQHWFNGPTTSINYTKIPNQILFVGRLNDANKGLEHVLSIPIGKYQIHCVGKGLIPKRPDLQQHTDIPQEELYKLYAQSSLLVVPSRYEAFSYVTLEALCSGTPVVISDRVRIKDFINSDDDCAVFKYGNTADFIQKVEHTVGKKIDAQKYIELFSKDKARLIYETLYRNIFQH